MAKASKGHHMIASDMYCTECGKKNIPVQRNIGKMREPGHLKKMYCIYCQRETNMVEIRPYGMKYNLQWFKLEYEMGNFKDGNRIIPLNEFKQKVHDLWRKNDDGET